MKESRDPERLRSLIYEQRMENVFPEELEPYLLLCNYDQGESICQQGGTAEYLYVLVEGKIKVFTTSPEGKALILSFKTPLEVIGDIEYIQGNPFINTVQAVMPTTMVAVHHRWLDKYGQSHPPLLQFLLQILTRKFYIKSNFMSFNLMHPVEVRLASYLLSISQGGSGAFESDPPDAFQLSDIANLLGTSYRHLNRVIHKFCKEGLIERRRGIILIKNREKLLEVAGGNIYEE
ncbi:Crp/Fnr family transcriptional regulator [Paenibacillus ihbetae]|uniref:Crp/Fnr family transcriptional regulator n=1 Tax=Paenibacillus ihbetae TaxID=1870820 RepID=A0ABX3JTZ5_9BACL|nr:Crp/Fnr family transcriptional regulator [Paenibacillus ihbetae]OOC61147.1 Crp/Fnr family transcriptional regulator [Paenibacillus ihbetae]